MSWTFDSRYELRVYRYELDKAIKWRDRLVADNALAKRINLPRCSATAWCLTSSEEDVVKAEENLALAEAHYKAESESDCSVTVYGVVIVLVFLFIASQIVSQL